MEVGFGLVQQQQTKLLMTPELRQSITILQYSVTDLMQFLREKSSENPLLELEEPEFAQEANIKEQPKENRWWDEEIQHGFDHVFSTEEYKNPIDDYVHKDYSLSSYLFEQCSYLHLSEKEKQLLHYLIGSLDEDGYLDASFAYLPSKMNCTEHEWEDALKKLQQLEPTGIGARSLEECLLLQLERLGEEDEWTRQVIQHHLHDLAANRMQQIAKKLNISLSEVQQIAAFIRTLHPKPGRLFHTQEPRYIYPDVIVEKVGQRYIVQVNDKILPRIHLNQYYEALRRKQETKGFLEQMYQQYQWISRSVQQRHQTILRVTEEIVKRQHECFEQQSFVYLKPLTLKQLAEQLGIHESTISRATRQKYAQTPWGVFELKSFFSNKASHAKNEEMSTEHVKQLIKQRIEQEDKRKPLSDQALVKSLENEGIKMARRTIAKYRDELGILSSTQRKKHS